MKGDCSFKVLETYLLFLVSCQFACFVHPFVMFVKMVYATSRVISSQMYLVIKCIFGKMDTYIY